MSKLDRKGQGAMEYLMTYGWAIMVVMIVGVVLWQMGVFSGFGCENSAKDFSAVKPLNPHELTVDSTGTLSGAFINTAGSTILLNSSSWDLTAPSAATATTINVNLAGQGAQDICTASSGTGTLSVPAGSTFQIVASGAGLTATSGESFSGNLVITYSMNVGGFKRGKLETGTIQGCIE